MAHPVPHHAVRYARMCNTCVLRCYCMQVVRSIGTTARFDLSNDVDGIDTARKAQLNRNPHDRLCRASRKHARLDVFCAPSRHLLKNPRLLPGALGLAIITHLSRLAGTLRTQWMQLGSIIFFAQFVVRLRLAPYICIYTYTYM